MAFDTQSSTTIIASATCDNCGEKGWYNGFNSTTAHLVTEEAELKIKGLWAGSCEILTDTICLFDEYDAYDPSCVSNLVFCNVVHKYQDFTTFDSVLGLGRIISNDVDT